MPSQVETLNAAYTSREVTAARIPPMMIPVRMARKVTIQELFWISSKNIWKAFSFFSVLRSLSMGISL